MTAALGIRAASCSEVGRRSRNEDRVRIVDDGERHLAIVADGAGGHHGGAEASRRAVEALERVIADEPAEFSPESLRRGVRAAHVHVQAGFDGASGESRMHSTIVALWVDLRQQLALWSHVGDSRLYRVRKSAVEQLTVDDSVVQFMLDAGFLTAEQAAAHPQKNQLVAALGVEDDVDPHTPKLAQRLEHGDAFLLCSDGWWDNVDAAAMADSLAASRSPDDWLAIMQLRIEARAAPRQDNFSAVAVWIGDPLDVTAPMAFDRTSFDDAGTGSM